MGGGQEFSVPLWLATRVEEVDVARLSGAHDVPEADVSHANTGVASTTPPAVNPNMHTMTAAPRRPALTMVTSFPNPRIGYWPSYLRWPGLSPRGASASAKGRRPWRRR